jgi:hypothetical protein
MNFFNDKRVRFAIGVAVSVATIALGLKWMFTGSLLSAADTIDEGKTGSVSTAVIPLLMDFIPWLMIAIGTYVVTFFRAAFGAIQKATQPDGSTAAATATDGSTPGRLMTDKQALERLVLDLGNAVAINDLPLVAELQRQLRLTFALDELSEAYRSGDITLGKSLAAEVEQLIATANDGDVPATVAARGGKRGAK